MSYRSLLSQLRKLQAMLASSAAVTNTTRTTQVGACLMVWHATCSTKISFIPDICMTLSHSECCIATLSLRVLAHMHIINLSDTDTYTQHTPLMKIQHLSWTAIICCWVSCSSPSATGCCTMFCHLLWQLDALQVLEHPRQWLYHCCRYSSYGRNSTYTLHHHADVLISHSNRTTCSFLF